MEKVLSETLHRGAATAMLAGFVAARAMNASGQDAIRASQAGADAAAARRAAASSIGYYDLKVGPTAWHFSTALNLQVTDNVNLTKTNADADVIVAPQVKAQMQWPVTELNSLNLNFGAGYSAYVNHSELSRFYILPGSALSFDIYAGDVWINLHDLISVSQNSYQDPTVSGTGGYSQLGNLAGITAAWDWSDKGTLKLGYDHGDYAGLTGDSGGAPDSVSELFYLATGYALKPESQAGVELTGGFTRFSGTNVQDATQWSAGGYYDAPISDYIHIHGSAGYTVYEAKSGGTNAINGQFTGVYGQIALRHKLNQYLTYTLSGGRTISYAFYGGALDLYSAAWQANWNIIHEVSLGTWVTFEHGTQLGVGGETFDRYGAGMNLGRSITKKLTGSVNYQFFQRSSDQAWRGYTANILGLSFSYVF